MSRLERKCLMASGGLHAFLVVVLVFGTAFLSGKPPEPEHTIMLVPPDLIDNALRGDGGDPTVPRTNDRKKGNTLDTVPAPAPAAPPETVQKIQPPPEPTKKIDPPKTQAKKVEAVKPTEPVKDPVKKTVESEKPRIDLTSLTPVNRNEPSKKRAQEEAEAKEAARAAAAERAANQAKNQRLFNDLRREIGSANERLNRGFNDGTAIRVGGSGGAAKASYRQFVQLAYDNAWIVSPELEDKDFVASIKVTIARDGRVLASRIIKPSGSASMDRSVQKAMDRVRLDGLPPFPPDMRESEQTFTIDFNLKIKAGLG